MPVDLTESQRELMQEMRRKWDAADTTHRKLRTGWDRLDALYHSRRDFLKAHAEAVDRDKPGVLDAARKEFGADLLIPYAFSVVETVLPRLLSNRPRMLWTPRDQASEQNVENVRIICDSQQQKANYELKLQTTGRSGLIYGLGVQKVYWRKEVAQRKRIVRGVHDTEWVEQEYACTLWDDPDVDDVSIYDFLWDPYGDSMETVGYVFHRSWRSTAYVLAKIESGAWPEVALTAEDLEGAGGKEKYAESWKGRWNAQQQTPELKEPVHEVWEYHNGARVITILNRMWPVAQAGNPAWHGRMPFHIFRPTEVLHQFHGKGEIEPIEDLAHEMNMLRTDRRWNALLKMHVAHFVQDGLMDLDNVKIGPGALIPIDAAGLPLRDILYPVNVGDIPNSGYQEEMALQADLERVSGISDSVSGASGAEQTATGVQLVQAAAGLRIQGKTRRVELELIKPEAADWLALNQQRIVEERTIAVPVLPKAGEPDRRWAWRKIGPAELAGEFDVEPDGGSTAPENVPQMRQDAQLLLGLMNAPGADPRKVLLLVFEKLGVKAPERMLAPDVHVPPQTLDLIAQALVEQLQVPPEAVNQIVGGALNQALSEEQQAQGGGGPVPAEPPQPPEQQAA